MAIITTAAHPKALWPGVFSMFGMTYPQHEEQWRKLVSYQTSELHREEMVQNNGFGLAAIKTEGASVGYDTTSQGGTATATHVVYALGYIVTEEEIEDNKYEKVGAARARALKMAMVRSKETVVANKLNRGFDTNYTGGADAKPLFSASHTSSSGNQSNLITAADISEAAIEDMIIQIMGATDDRGNKIKLQAQSLHVPRQLLMEATRIMKSTLQNDSANNAVNALRVLNQLPDGIHVNNYLSDADAWFIKTDVPDGLTLFQRRPLRFAKDNDFGTGNALAKADERYSVQWGDFRTFYGSEGA